MKTLHLVGNWESDVGYAWKMIERFWIELARNHAGRTILTFPKVRGLSPELKTSGIEIIEFKFDFSRPKELVRFVREQDVGHLYLTDQLYSSSVYRKLRRAGVETITFHDHTPGGRTIPTGPKRFLKTLKTRFAGADAYIATTEYIRERHLNVVCAPPARCYVARNGVHPNLYTRAQSTIRQELGISPDTVLIVSSSRATAYKRIHEIVDAAMWLQDRDVCFIHCGRGNDTKYFEALQERARGLNNFRLLGDRNDVLKILPACDIAVHAAEGEVGYSLAMLEFMAAGLPTVVRNDPSVCGCIKDEVTGLLFKNTDELLTKLDRLIRSREGRQRMGLAAQAVVLQKYRLTDTISSVVSIMKAVSSGEWQSEKDPLPSRG